MTDLSIVFGTYNRLPMLTRCIESVRASVGPWLSYEIVITDGGSTDGTLDYLRAQPDVKLIEHGELRGAVSAYNDAFREARGQYVAHLNDDLVVNGTTLWDSYKELDNAQPLRRSEVGQLAFLYGAKKYSARLPYGLWLYAAFGMTRRNLGEQVGWFDGYHYYCGDIHLSLSIWKAGYTVEFAPGSVTHLYAPNTVRGGGSGVTVNKKADWNRFYETWRDYGNDTSGRAA